jgi:hypothetical protein
VPSCPFPITRIPVYEHLSVSDCHRGRPHCKTVGGHWHRATVGAQSPSSSLRSSQPAQLPDTKRHPSCTSSAHRNGSGRCSRWARRASPQWNNRTPYRARILAYPRPPKPALEVAYFRALFWGFRQRPYPASFPPVFGGASGARMPHRTCCKTAWISGSVCRQSSAECASDRQGRHDEHIQRKASSSLKSSP